MYLNTQKAGMIPAFFLVLLSWSSLQAEAVQGIWVVRHSITSPVKVRRLIQFAAENHYTDLFIQVRGRSDAYYNSQIVPRASLLPRNNYDPLQDILVQAHARGIKVHAWINMYLSWSARSLPSDPQHIVNQHPDWVEVNGRGKSDLEFVAQNGRNGREGIYLSPANRDVNAYLLTVINEIVRNYAVDGIHLDYFRYQDRDYGYNRASRKKFLMQYNVDPITLGNGKGSYWYRLNPQDKEKYWILWNDFRREELTQFIDRIHKSIRYENPTVKLSVAVKPNPEIARTRFFQDWSGWVKDGKVDFVVPMNYAVSESDFVHSIRAMESAHLPAEKLYMGIATYNQKSQSSSAKIGRARREGYRNLIIFSYDTYEKNPRYFDRIHQALNH